MFSICFPKKVHTHTGCICLTFLHCAFPDWCATIQCPARNEPAVYPGQPYLPFLFYLYFSQISKCIWLKLQIVFVPNCSMPSSQIAKCICLKWTSSVSRATLLTLPLPPNSLSLPLSLALWPPHPHSNGHLSLWALQCGEPQLIAKKHEWVHPICQKMFSIWEIYLLHPNFNMYCVSHHVSGLRIWDAGIFCPFGIKSLFSLAFEQIYANIVVEGCLTLLKNVSWDAFHKFPQIFILEIVNLLKECLVISDGAKSLLKVSLQKKGGWNTKYLPSKLLPCSSKNIQKMHFL